MTVYGVPYEDAISWWKLDETVSGPVVDTQGNDNLTNSGATINQTGKWNKCYLFSGSNQYLYKTSGMTCPTSAISIAFWVKCGATSAGYAHLCGLGGDRYFAFYMQPNTLQLHWEYLNIGGGSGDVSIGTLDTNWHLVVVTYDGSNVRTYVDFVIQNTTPLTGAIGYTDTSFFIGVNGTAGGAYGNFFAGSFDEFRIYNRAITQAEINGLFYNNQLNYSITTTVSGGSGLSTISVGAIPSGTAYHYGDSIAIDESPATGDTWGSWSGDISGSTHPQNLSVTRNMSVTGTWTYTQYLLTLIQDARMGSVAANPTNSSGMPSGYYKYTESIVLTVTPLSSGRNAAFKQWQDANTDNPRTITMPAANTTYTAVWKWRKIYVQTYGNAGDGASGSKNYYESFGTNSPDLVTATDLKTWGPSGKLYNQTYGELT